MVEASIAIMQKAMIISVYSCDHDEGKSVTDNILMLLTMMVMVMMVKVTMVTMVMMMMMMVMVVMIEGTKGNWGRSEVAAPPIRVLGASAPGPWRYFWTWIFAPCNHMLTSFNAENAFNKRLLGGCDEERGFLLLP